METAAKKTHPAIRTEKKESPIMVYWDKLKDFDNAQKLELVARLVESIRPSYTAPEPEKNGKGNKAPKKDAKKKKPDINDYYGIWSDKEYMDAEELVKVIREGRRHSNSSRDEFWKHFFEEED